MMEIQTKTSDSLFSFYSLFLGHICLCISNGDLHLNSGFDTDGCLCKRQGNIWLTGDNSRSFPILSIHIDFLSFSVKFLIWKNCCAEYKQSVKYFLGQNNQEIRSFLQHHNIFYL